MAITGSTDFGDGLLGVTVDADPTVTPVDAPTGSLIQYLGTLYQKQDDGSTTNVRGVVVLNANGQIPSSQLPGGSGTGVVDFGSGFPGKSDTTLVITGQALIQAGSLVQAWVTATATADHSVDEHLVDMPAVSAGTIAAGVGFTIYAAAVGLSLRGQYSVSWRWA